MINDSSHEIPDLTPNNSIPISLPKTSILISPFTFFIPSSSFVLFSSSIELSGETYCAVVCLEVSVLMLHDWLVNKLSAWFSWAPQSASQVNLASLSCMFFLSSLLYCVCCVLTVFLRNLAWLFLGNQYYCSFQALNLLGPGQGSWWRRLPKRSPGFWRFCQVLPGGRLGPFSDVIDDNFLPNAM